LRRIKKEVADKATPNAMPAILAMLGTLQILLLFIKPSPYHLFAETQNRHLCTYSASDGGSRKTPLIQYNISESKINGHLGLKSGHFLVKPATFYSFSVSALYVVQLAAYLPV